jgi:hypothetical protein
MYYRYLRFVLPSPQNPQKGASMRYVDQACFSSFLTTCSKISLSDFLLAKQNRAANLEKQLSQISAELSENLVLIELANLIRSPARSNVCSIEKGRGPAELPQSPKPFAPNFWRFAGLRKDLSKNEVWTYTAIKALVNENGIQALTKDQISKWCRLSPRSVQYALKGLRSKGFIVTQKRKWDMLVKVLRPPSQEEQPLPVLNSQEEQPLPVLNSQEEQPLLPSTYVLPERPKTCVVDDRRRPIESVLTDDDLLADFLLMKFKPDTERFPGLTLEHIKFAIVRIRDRAASPPGSVRYWMIAMEKFLIDYAGELKSAEQKTLIEKERRIGSGPVASHHSVKKKAAG